MIPYAHHAMHMIGAEIRYAVETAEPESGGTPRSDPDQAGTDPRIKCRTSNIS